MEILFTGNEKVKKVWGNGKINYTGIYRLLKYIIRFETNYGFVLLNTVTGETVLLESEEANTINALPSTYHIGMETLIEKHYLVEENYRDKDQVQNLRKIMKTTDQSHDITSFTILPTTACNARCFYCYEANYKPYSMTDEVIEQTIRYIFENCPKKKVSINWFGGEPLLGERAIDIISRSLSDAGFVLSSTMISNGYLFDEQMIAKAVDIWRLKTVQITIDGTEDIYNKVKNYRNSSGSPYYRVLNNIELLLKKGINVAVRINLDFHNLNDIEALVDELIQRFHLYPKFNAYIHTLYENKGFQPVSHTDKETNDLKISKERLERKLQNRSIFSKVHSLPSLSTNCCMADNPHHIMIHPEGSLVRCEHSYYDEKVGSLSTGITDLEKMRFWTDTVTYQDCDNCVLYPSCVIAKNCPVRDVCSQSTVNCKINGYREMIENRLSTYKYNK